MKTPKPVIIYDYTDYRRFLLHKFQEKKEKERSFSHRKFALNAGISSSNFLNLVMQNKRNLSETGIRKFAKGFRLTENQGEYFHNMVLMNQSKDHEEKDCFYKKMVKCKGFAKTHFLDKKEYEYYSAWYHPVVRELIAFNNGKIDAEWIAEHVEPRITVAQAKRSLKLLEKLGMIKRADDRWIQTDPIVDTGPEISSILVAKYHKNMISMAKESIERFPSDQRDVSSVTIRANRTSIREIKKTMNELRRQLLGLECSEGEEEFVLQVNIQAFPMSKVPKGGEE